MRLTHLLLAAAVLGMPAQGRWQQIGTTSTGNAVFLDAKSVKKAPDGIVTASLRTAYAKPVKTPKGGITSVRSVAMFDCGKRMIAVKESVIYIDEAKNVVYERSAPAKPGFGPVFTSNYSAVAMDYLCKKP